MNLNDIRKGIVKGSFYTSSGQIISIFLLFISTVILARFIDPNELGLFFLLISISSFLEMLISFGLEPTLVKFMSEATKENKNNIFNKILSFRLTSQLFFTSFLIIINLILKIWVSENWLAYSFYILILFNFLSIRNFFNAYLQSNKSFRPLMLVHIIQPILKVSLYLVTAFISSLTINILLYVEIGSILLTILLQINYVKDKIRFELVKFDFVKRILTFSFPLYLNSFVNVFSTKINTFFIASFAGFTDVANYEIAKKIPDAFNRLASSITLVYYPYISDLFGANKIKTAENILNNYLKFFFTLSIPILLIFFIFSDEITVLVFSDNYKEISSSIFLLLTTYLFSLTSSIMGYTLVASGNPKLSFRINSIRSIISISISLPLITIYGYKGAIYSILLSNIIGFYLSIAFLKNVKIIVEKFILVKFLSIGVVIVSFIMLLDNFINRTILLSTILSIILLISYILFTRSFRRKLLLLVK